MKLNQYRVFPLEMTDGVDLLIANRRKSVKGSSFILLSTINSSTFAADTLSLHNMCIILQGSITLGGFRGKQWRCNGRMPVPEGVFCPLFYLVCQFGI